MKKVIKTQKIDQYTLSSVQSTLKKVFQLNLEEDERQARCVGELTQGTD